MAMPTTTAGIFGRRREEVSGMDQLARTRSSCTALSVPGEMARCGVFTFAVQWDYSS